MPHESGLAPVMTGSHIDTVATGGRYDGNLGVLAGLEVIETVLAAGVELARPLAVGYFTNEEGARFAPDMLGSLVYVGGLPVEDALLTEDAAGAVLGDELDRIGYRGGARSPGRRRTRSSSCTSSRARCSKTPGCGSAWSRRCRGSRGPS